MFLRTPSPPPTTPPSHPNRGGPNSFIASTTLGRERKLACLIHSGVSLAFSDFPESICLSILEKRVRNILTRQSASAISSSPTVVAMREQIIAWHVCITAITCLSVGPFSSSFGMSPDSIIFLTRLCFSSAFPLASRLRWRNHFSQMEPDQHRSLLRLYTGHRDSTSAGLGATSISSSME